MVGVRVLLVVEQCVSEIPSVGGDKVDNVRNRIIRWEEPN